ncbi:MAG TPA: class I SAM-dependent methyltransferase [Chthoniobacterales bacterium]
MNRKVARRLPGVGKFVRALDELQAKYARLKAQRDDLKVDLAEAQAQLAHFFRERNEREASRIKQEHPLPVPPAPLRLRVHGTDDEASFITVGNEVASQVRQILANAGRPLDTFARILDFGCGCGRVIGYLGPRPGLFGTDLDQEAIKWCEQNLSDVASFRVNGDKPPLPFESESFDFVYAISVFTHLPENLELLWLEELRRVTKPGGILLLTVHGEKLFRRVPYQSRAELKAHGFCHPHCGSTPGLPDYYQTSFHTEDYIRGTWSKFFGIKSIESLGSHDAILCERESAAAS